MAMYFKSFCDCCIWFRDVADEDNEKDEDEDKIEYEEKDENKGEGIFEILMDCIFSGRC